MLQVLCPEQAIVIEIKPAARQLHLFALYSLVGETELERHAIGRRIISGSAQNHFVPIEQLESESQHERCCFGGIAPTGVFAGDPVTDFC